MTAQTTLAKPTGYDRYIDWRLFAIPLGPVHRDPPDPDAAEHAEDRRRVRGRPEPS